MTYTDLQNLFYELTKSNSTSIPVATLNLYTQPAEDRAAAFILKNDSKWQWDDLNRTTDFPIDTQNLVSSQQDYPLGTTYLSLDRVEIKDASGNWIELTQIDQQDLKRGRRIALGQYQNVAGAPLQYDLVANSVFLYPAPNYNSTNGLKFYYTRGPLKFDYTTSKFTDGTGSTSSSPGFASPYHEIIAYYAAEKWAIANVSENAQGFTNTIARIERDMKDFYGNRNRDRRARMTTANVAQVGSQSGVLGIYGNDSNK